MEPIGFFSTLLECDRRNADALKLRFILVRDDDETQQLVCIGFRMDKGEDEHGFYHAQLIRCLQGDDTDEDYIECPRWLPETQPSLPICAVSSATLLLCMLLSIYGLEGFGRLVSEFSHNHVHRLPEHLRKFREWFNLGKV